VSQAHGITTIHGLSVSDADAGANEPFMMTATAASGSSVILEGGTDTLAHVNSALEAGVAYMPTTTPATDNVTVTVTDSHGAADSVNFIFNMAEPPQNSPVVLTGTAGNDVFFATGYPDQFVFAAGSGHDTIMNFDTAHDQIDISHLTSPTTGTLASWLATAAVSQNDDTLIHLDPAHHDTILLRGVSAATLTASDFIVHS
jgi:Ca2+-binding RTX toxin-like protein